MLVNTEHPKRHDHKGKSSQYFLNPGKILETVGLKSGERVLDLGCGSGYVSIAAASVVGRKGAVYAVDSDPHAIEILNETVKTQKLGNIKPIRVDAANGLTLDAHSIDLCLMINVLHGFVANSEVEAVALEVLRTLKDSGRLVVVEFRKGGDTPGPPMDIRLSPAEVARLLGRKGFVEDRLFQAGPFHYGLILKKKY